MARPAPSPLRSVITRLRGLFRKSAEERYIAFMQRKLAAGVEHSTIGPVIRDEAYTRAKAERWARHMVEYGLKPEHLCVEYGCGSLWAAEPIIRMLEPGRFVGLDITDQFYEFGRQRLGALIEERRVRLGVIAPAKLREVAALRPDFLFSRKVLEHVAEEAVPRYLANVCSLLTPTTIAVLDNSPVITEDGSVTGRRYTVETLRALLPAGFEIEQSRYGALLRRRA